MLGIGKFSQSLFYIEYSIYTPILSLWIKGCQLFRNCMWDATHNKYFGLGLLTDINELHKRIYYIVGNIFVLFYQWLYDRVVCDVYPGPRFSIRADPTMSANYAVAF